MKPGSIILIKSKGFLPDQIRMHMAIYAKQTGRKPLPYNHAECVVLYRGNLVSMGARSGGAEISPLADYLKAHPDHLILEPVQDLNSQELWNLESYADQVCFIDKRPYQYLMFLGWIAKLKTWGRLQWGNRTDKRVYCFELAARCARVSGRWDGSVELVSVYDLFENKHFKIL